MTFTGGTSINAGSPNAKRAIFTSPVSTPVAMSSGSAQPTHWRSPAVASRSPPRRTFQIRGRCSPNTRSLIIPFISDFRALPTTPAPELAIVRKPGGANLAQCTAAQLGDGDEQPSGWSQSRDVRWFRAIRQRLDQPANLVGSRLTCAG